MSRRNETTILDDIFGLLKMAPIWVGPILAVVTFVLFRFFFPAVTPTQQGGINVGAFLGPLFKTLSWYLAGAVLVAWIAAEIWKLFNRRLLDTRTNLASIQDISWQQFERLVCEAYRRKGYVAEVVGSEGGDGGVDIRLTGRGERVLVQCKQWRAYQVGVSIVRELLGVVVNERADRGIVVTSGRFTREAMDFARQNPRIELVDGPQLAQLIQNVQVRPTEPIRTPCLGSGEVTEPTCPLCGSSMLLRTARKGQNAGSQFWGCSKYPQCRGIRQHETVQA